MCPPVSTSQLFMVQYHKFLIVIIIMQRPIFKAVVVTVKELFSL